MVPPAAQSTGPPGGSLRKPGHPASLGPLVAAKLTAPTLPHGYRERPRLSEQLDAALYEATRLTLVSAPPGYGKSIAVAGWLASSGSAFAWLTLDSADNDPVRCIHYLVGALRRVRPDVGEATLGLVATGTTLNVGLLGSTLVNELAASEDPFALVIDDFQAITAEPIRELVRFLVQQAPPFVHIVVVSRRDPLLPLARLRAHARLVELRADDLRFTRGEAAAFLEDVMGGSLATELAARVTARTDGWAAALQLAAVALRDRPDAPAQIDALTSSRRAVFDYLADEVLAGLDDELRDFLVAVSVAERFTPELCASLTGRDDAAQLLSRAEQANLFVARVVSDTQWYRYHPLFAEYLRSLLRETEAKALHARVADFLEHAGLRQDAIHHALAAGDTDHAVRLVEREARHAFESGQLLGLLGWLDSLPPERVAASPELVSFQGWSLLFTGQVEAAIACAATSLDPRDATSQAEGRLLALRAVLATVAGTGAEALATSAFELIGDDHFFRAIALLALGMERWTHGEIAAGLASWRTALDEAMEAGQPMAVALAATALASGLHDTGARPEAEALCRRVLKEYEDASGAPPPMTWFVRMPLGLLRYEANDIVEARRELERGFEGAGVFGFGRVLAGFAIDYLALTRQATGSPEEALEAVRASSRAMTQAGFGSRIPSELEARIELLQGNLDAAVRWADRQPSEPELGPPPFDALPMARDTTVARVRLAQGRPGDALRALAGARAIAERMGLVADLISIGILQAAAAEAAGDPAAARSALAEAVRLAAPGGYVRRFVDDGAAVARLLPDVRRAAPAFVDQVIAALEPRGLESRRAGSRALLVGERGELLEMLTGRELDVVRLLARGATNAEIADGLSMSPGTARWHVGNILSKLGARNRTEAMARVLKLGLV
jgi:LuxR family maltose regulon positive regulatory protein